MIAALLIALLAAQAAPAARPAKDVAPVTVSPTPANAPPADARITIGGDMDHIGPQDVLIWPTGARERGLSGEVTLACRIDVHGLAETCRIAAESPVGRGFGRAALALRPVLKVAPRRGADGDPIDSTMNIAIAFRAGEASSNLSDIVGKGNDLAPGSSDNNPMSSGVHEVNPRNLVVYGNPVEMRPVTLLDSRLWAAAPDFAELAAAYPAKGGGAEGFAVAHCKAQRDGALRGCTVARETPAGHGFGKAALALVDRFRLSPEVMAQAPRADAPIEADVPIRFPPPAEAADQTVRSPVWLPGYDPESQMQGFPRQLAKAASPGALVKCRVGPDGGLTDCGIELTSPDGIDYDAAAVTYAGRLKMSLWSAEAGPVRGGVVHLPVKAAGP